MKIKNKQDGPGRPKADITIPNKRFTFAEFCEVNDHVIPLTLRKFLARDMFHPIASGKNKGKPDRNNPRRNSVIVLTDQHGEPDHRKGLGRKTLIYCLRSNYNGTKTNGLKTANKSKVTVRVGKTTDISAATKSYEATKAALLAPAVTVTAPEPPPAAPAPVAPDATTATPEVSQPVAA